MEISPPFLIGYIIFFLGDLLCACVIFIDCVVCRCMNPFPDIFLLEGELS
jgi:hypothetical protein